MNFTAVLVSPTIAAVIPTNVKKKSHSHTRTQQSIMKTPSKKNSLTRTNDNLQSNKKRLPNKLFFCAHWWIRQVKKVYFLLCWSNNGGGRSNSKHTSSLKIRKNQLFGNWCGFESNICAEVLSTRQKKICIERSTHHTQNKLINSRWAKCQRIN